MMSPFLRKFTLTTHVTLSVGWLGAVAGFLALAIAGLVSRDSQAVRSYYISMELVGWFVIVPACLGSLISGIIQSLGTKWGLFRHYWIVAKFILTVISTLLLLLHMKPISHLAEVAAKSTLSYADLRGLRIQLTADAAVALAVLIIAVILSIYKPWGKTKYGIRKQIEENKSSAMTENSKPKSNWSKIILIILLSLIGVVVIWHLKGGGFHH